MGKLRNIWNWLSIPKNQKTVAFIGSGVVVVTAAIWTVFTFFYKPSPPQGTQTTTGIHIEGGVKVDRGSIVNIQNIQTTPDQFDALLKKRLKEVMAELPTAEAERRAVLLKELDAIKAKYDNLQKAHEEQQAKLAEAYKALDDFKKDFAPDQVKQAQKALSQGETGNAEALFQKALDQSTAQAAEAAYQLGVLAESRINYLKAQEYYAKAVQLQPDNPQYLNALGNLQHTLGLYSEAQPHLEQALKIREKNLGPDHPDVATSLNNLALLYDDQGKYAEAEPLYQRARKIDEKALGPEHPEVAIHLNNLAELYREQGKYAEAEPLYQRALKIDEKALGPEHPNVAIRLNNLAMLYQNQGKYAEAEPLYQRALKIDEKALGPEHPNVAIDLNNLAMLYQNQGKYAEAEPLLQRALRIWEKALGPEHPNVATGLENYADLLRKMGREAEAVPLEDQAKAIRAKQRGNN
jgi:tetratricopeptide (TPR) repeat protein